MLGFVHVFLKVDPSHCAVRMAERSKVPDSGRQYLPHIWDFWSPIGGVVSNPTPDTYFERKNVNLTYLITYETVMLC